MNQKKCDICGNYYDYNLNSCPNCNSKDLGSSGSFNINNSFLSSNYLDEKKDSEYSSLGKSNNLSNKIDSTQPNSNTDKILKNEDLTEKIIENKHENKKNTIIADFNDPNFIESVIPSKSSDNSEKANLSSLDKKKKNSKTNTSNGNYLFLSYLYLIISMIVLFIVILSCTNKVDIPILIHYVSSSVLLIIAFSLTFRNKKIGYFIAILGSIAMIFMFLENDFINCFIGAFLLISSITSLILKK